MSEDIHYAVMKNDMVLCAYSAAFSEYQRLHAQKQAEKIGGVVIMMTYEQLMAHTDYFWNRVCGLQASGIDSVTARAHAYGMTRAEYIDWLRR